MLTEEIIQNDIEEVQTEIRRQANAHKGTAGHEHLLFLWDNLAWLQSALAELRRPPAPNWAASDPWRIKQ